LRPIFLLFLYSRHELGEGFMSPR